MWIATGLSTELTGIERVCIECARAARSPGVSQSVIVDSDARWTSELPREIDVIVLKPRRGGVARTPEISDLPGYLRSAPVVAHSFGAPPPALTGRLSYTVHDWGPWSDSDIPLRARLAWRSAMMRGVRRADLLHFYSRSVEAEAPPEMRLLMRHKAKVYGLPFPVYRQTVSPAVESRSPGAVISVGTDVARKRFRYLIDACRTQAGISLTLAGSGTERYNVPGGDRAGPVVGLGRVSEERLSRLYQTCALFALVSSYEGFGLPVLEAWLQGASLLLSESVAARIPDEIVAQAHVVADQLTASELGDALVAAMQTTPGPPAPASVPLGGELIASLLACANPE